MKKIIIISIILFTALSAKAGENDTYFTISGGWQKSVFQNKHSLIGGRIGIEFEKRYYKAWELYFDYAKEYEKYPSSNIAKNNKYFFSEDIYTLGLAYKIPIIKGKNQHLRFNPNFNVATATHKSFQFGLGIDLEYTVYLSRKVHFYSAIRNSYMFLGKHNLRNGIYIGFKFNM